MFDVESDVSNASQSSENLQADLERQGWFLLGQRA